jgi:hypothetical protein
MAAVFCGCWFLLAARGTLASDVGAAHLLWHFPLANDRQVEPRLIVSNGIAYASAGKVLYAVDPWNRRVLWRRNHVRRFYVHADRIFAWNENVLTALTLSGRPLWQRSVCHSQESVRDVTADADRVFIACVYNCCTPSRVIAVRSLDGSTIYVLDGLDDAVVSLQFLGSDLLVRENFSGAYSGEYEYFYNPTTGHVIGNFNTHDIVTVRDGAALLDDRLILDIGIDAYKPAILSWFDLHSGQQSTSITLAPSESDVVEPGYDSPKYHGGPTFVAGNWLYLKLGPMLYRYALPDFKRREIVMRDAGRMYSYSDQTAIVDTAATPKNHLVFLDLRNGSVKSRVIASLESAIDMGGDTVVTAEPFFVTNDRSPYLVDALQGRAFHFDSGWDVSASFQLTKKQVLLLVLDPMTVDYGTGRGAELRLYALR